MEGMWNTTAVFFILFSTSFLIFVLFATPGRFIISSLGHLNRHAAETGGQIRWQISVIKPQAQTTVTVAQRCAGRWADIMMWSCVGESNFARKLFWICGNPTKFKPPFFLSLIHWLATGLQWKVEKQDVIDHHQGWQMSCAGVGSLCAGHSEQCPKHAGQ